MDNIKQTMPQEVLKTCKKGSTYQLKHNNTFVSNVMDVYWFITFDICAFSYIPISKGAVKHLLERNCSPFTYPIQFTELALTIPVNM
jgi:hypothetical protein